MVSLFGWTFARKHRGNPQNFTQEGRDLGVESRKLKFVERQKEHEIEMAKKELELLDIKAQISDLSGDDEEGFDAEGLLLKILAPSLIGGQQSFQEALNSAVPPSAPSKRTFSEGEIRALLERLPKPARKALKKMDREHILDLAQLYAPDFLRSADEQSIETALKVVQE